MKSHHRLLMPVLHGRDHLDRRLAGLLPWYSTVILLDVFQPGANDEENVRRLRDAASGAPSRVQRVMPVALDHALLLLAATPAHRQQAVRYAEEVAGERNYVVWEDGTAQDRLGLAVPGTALDAGSIDQWAAHLGVPFRAEGLYDRTVGFVAYAAAMKLP